MAGAEKNAARAADPATAAAADFAKACEALAPAFALALTQAWAAPERLAEISRALGPPAARREPEALLDALFGGRAFREAVAGQAAAMSGATASAVAAAMPHLAAMGADAMARTLAGGTATAPGAPFATDAFGPFVAETMRRYANAVEAFSRPSGAPPPRAASAALGGWFANPFLDAFAPPAPKSAAPAPAASADVLDAFVRSGQRFREDYAKGMSTLFERFPGAGDAGSR